MMHFPSEKRMREGLKKASAQTPLLGYFVRNAQRRSFDPFFLRGKPLTHFGGMWLIQRFCNKLGLKKRLQDYVRPSQRQSQYRSSELILALLYAVIMGLRRINKTDILQYNGAFLEPFLKVCLAKAPSSIARSRIRFRMD